MTTENRDFVILVDEDDNPSGSCEKLRAHELGLLHRAFSIFIFNNKQELLLQKRHADKYHSAGLWSNTCCSHPRPGESTETASLRRLREETGIDCPVTEAFVFHYRARLEGSDLVENEIDHVFKGYYEGPVSYDNEEIEEVKWIGRDDLLRDLRENPGNYTIWFKIIIDKVLAYMESLPVRGNG